jgi:hypothetical protein
MTVRGADWPGSRSVAFEDMARGLLGH